MQQGIGKSLRYLSGSQEKDRSSLTGYWNWDATENIHVLVNGMITHNTSESKRPYSLC